MNFVQTLEESLRDLASEARKRHPGVKEASERATLRLRALQNQYVSQVRQANAGTAGVEHPTTRLFANSEILHPFLLAANYPNASADLLEIAFGAMRLLMEADAIHYAVDAIQMLRVWMIQAQGVVAYYQKQYAKEILQLETQQQQQATVETTQQSSSYSELPAASSTTSSSSWFSWGSSSSTSVTTAADSTSSSKHGVVQSTKSSTTTSQQSPAQMEHRAKQILSCLLQLLENLKQYPDYLTLELWTNATALSCLWLHYTPLKHTVHQAARSTLRQVMNLLFSVGSTNTAAATNDKLLLTTWEDLLQLADNTKTNLHGAFQLCKRNVAQMATVHPPTPELALELLTQTLREHANTCRCFVEMPDKLLQKTMGISVKLLQDKRTTLEKSLRTMQWTCVLFQHYHVQYPSECRELFALILKPIAAATEACRSHDDFEDGYVLEDVSDGTSWQDTATKKTTTAKQQLLATLIPPSTLWKAGFALEAIYNILELDNDPASLRILLDDARIVVSLSETLSDFATIGASCRDHILQLVVFGTSLPYTGTEVFAKTSVKIKPTFFRKAEQACASGNVQSLLSEGTVLKSSSAATDMAVSSGAASSSQGLLGEALWVSLQNLLRISECMNGADNVDQMLEQTFAPSLAVLQHYLKRCVGSSDLVQLVLKGFVNLADVCLPRSGSHRKALLLSLCKLSLPTWGKRDSTCQLQDHHVMTLLYLCRIVHTHFEFIGDDWSIVLKTLDELSAMTVASKNLSDEFYYAALALSILFGRLAPFTTSFSTKSLIKLAESLSEIARSQLEGLDIVGNSDTVLAPRPSAAENLVRQTSGDAGDGSISSKIINIGARAIYGSGSEADKQVESNSMKDRASVMFYEDYRREFVKRISSGQSTIRVASVGHIPFILAALVDVIMANSFRFEECGDQLSELLSNLASSSPAVRPFAMDVLSVLAMSHLSSDRALPASFIGPARLIFTDPMQSQLWAVEVCPEDSDSDKSGLASKENEHPKSQADLLWPLCQKIRTADKPGMAESSLGALNAILEGVGHNMSGEVWCSVIDAVASLAGDPNYETVDRTPVVWSNCSSMAFRCLKFIVDDFREQIAASESASKTLTSLLDCCASFGRSKHDVNTSLTAITLLWTIADQDPGSDSIDRALSRLVDLASDSRAEVRNASVNTLFSCIVGRGSSFANSRWESCFSETIFSVYDLVAINASLGDGKVKNEQKGQRYRVSLHHSRDSNQKQWLETQTLVLRGLTRVVRNYFPQLLRTSDIDEADSNAPWILGAWATVLDYAFEATTHDGDRDTVAIRTAGVDLMILCCQAASKAGIEAATAPARVGTNMEVINGALRTVRGSQPTKNSFGTVVSTSSDATRTRLYLEAFVAIEAYNDAVVKSIKQGGAADETLVQVIHSYITGLSHLYDCSRGSELIPRGICILTSLDGLEDSPDSKDEMSGLECRFVRIVASMLVAAGGFSSSRFLNQAQRASLSLLRTMASFGSAVAFKELIDIADQALFLKRSETVANISILCFDAADAVSEEVMKETVSDECKVFVIHYVLSLFLRQDSEDETHSPATSRGCKHLIPVMTAGLNGLNRLPVDDPTTRKATEIVWRNLINCLSRLLSLTMAESSSVNVENASDLLTIISLAGENVPEAFLSEMGTLLSNGASTALTASREHHDARRGDALPENDETDASQDTHETLLKLFRMCYSLCCEVQPVDPGLTTLTRSVLTDTLQCYVDKQEAQDFHEEVAFIICECLQSKKLESLVITVFAQLSRLATAETVSIRDAVSAVFNVVDVASILETARETCEAAEERARTAEARNQELTKKVKVLQQRNVELTQEVAVLQASSAM